MEHETQTSNKRANTAYIAKLIGGIISVLGVVFAGISAYYDWKSDQEKTNYDQSIVSDEIDLNSNDILPNVSSTVDIESNVLTTKNPPTYIGEIIKFGKYEQDNDMSNGKESIEWRVLDVKGNNVLIITKDLLEYIPFNTGSESVNWNTCTLHQWLNKDFLQMAFSSDEINKILYNSDLNAKLFLLSASEIENYFSSETDRVSHLTVYATIHLVEKKGVSTEDEEIQETAKKKFANAWWLRDSGNRVNRAAIVDYAGNIIRIGYDVSNTGIAVRPAMWIEL